MSKAFSLFLQELRDGRVHSEISGHLNELLTKVKESGKGGDISLKIKVKPASRGGDVDKVVISDLITVNLPKQERGEDFFWLTDDNELSRNHPKQGNLELREAPTTKPIEFKDAV